VILNYKTVISFGEKNVVQIISKFESLLVEPSRLRIRNAHLGGLAFGYSQCSRMIYLGLVFWIASVVIRKWHYSPMDVYMAINIIFSAAMGAGVSMSNIPSVSKAKYSASEIFSIVDEKSTLDVRDGNNASIQDVKVG
jgi:ABC-type multidrug transport system fused ATPase/permease subunit